jgi:hypothetical protein
MARRGKLEAIRRKAGARAYAGIGPALAAVLRPDAIRRRIRGETFGEIAAALGVTVPTVATYINESLDQLRQLAGVEADRARTLELWRLDGLIQGNWARATGEDGEPANYQATLVVLKAIELRCKIQGLFLQEAIDPRTVAVSDLQRILLERKREALAAARAAGVELTLPSPKIEQIEVVSDGYAEGEAGPSEAVADEAQPERDGGADRQPAEPEPYDPDVGPAD